MWNQIKKFLATAHSWTGLQTFSNLTVTTALTNTALTATRIPIAGTAGLLGDDSALVWDASDNLLLDGVAVGTSGAKVIVRGSGTAPTTSPADCAQMWVQDKSSVAGHAGFHMRDEFGNTGPVAFAQLKVVSHSATENALASQMYGHNHIVTGAYTISIPTATVGYHVGFMASTAAVFSVDVVTGTDAFYLNGTLLTAGNKITSDGTIRATVEIKCVLAGFYEAWSNSLFVDGGA
jgi:hypothetical protein